jgi:hypothetical protein
VPALFISSLFFISLIPVSHICSWCQLVSQVQKVPEVRSPAKSDFTLPGLLACNCHNLDWPLKESSVGVMALWFCRNYKSDSNNEREGIPGDRKHGSIHSLTQGLRLTLVERWRNVSDSMTNTYDGWLETPVISQKCHRMKVDLCWCNTVLVQTVISVTSNINLVSGVDWGC